MSYIVVDKYLVGDLNRYLV